MNEMVWFVAPLVLAGTFLCGVVCGAKFCRCRRKPYVPMDRQEPVRNRLDEPPKMPPNSFERY